MRRARLREILVWVAAMSIVAAAGCAQAPTRTESDPPGERYARSFDRAVYGEWIPASKVPPTPTEGPEQVIWEVSRYPNRPPTPEHDAAADELRQRSIDAAQRRGWFEYERGVADGFERQWLDETHYYKWEYITDDAVLDPERPEYLMYYKTDEGQVLAGFMFLVGEPTGEGPQPAGPLTVWHYHLFNHPHCYRGGLVLKGHPEGGQCYDSVMSNRSPEMIHVWFVNHPEGRFATRMKLDDEMLRQALREENMNCCME